MLSKRLPLQIVRRRLAVLQTKYAELMDLETVNAFEDHILRTSGYTKLEYMVESLLMFS